MNTLATMALYLSLFTIPIISNALSPDKCAFAAFNDQANAAFCFGIGGAGAKLYNITDTNLTIDNIATICPSVKWARANGVTCEYGDLVWNDGPDGDLSSCPKCPCDDTVDGTDTSYMTFENYYDQKCVACTCNTFTGGSLYGWDCKQYGDVSLFPGTMTTSASWTGFECNSTTGPSVTCSANGNEYLPGDGYWSDEANACDKFCICESDGTSTCRDGYDNILGADDPLREAFVTRCGEKVQGVKCMLYATR